MSRIIHYDILAGVDSKQLAARVNDKIAAGWEPLGAPFTHAKQLLQAMVTTAAAQKRIRKNSED